MIDINDFKDVVAIKLKGFPKTEKCDNNNNFIDLVTESDEIVGFTEDYDVMEQIAIIGEAIAYTPDNVTVRKAHYSYNTKAYWVDFKVEDPNWEQRIIIVVDYDILRVDVYFVEYSTPANYFAVSFFWLSDK
jgi:hypothetical protein